MMKTIDWNLNKNDLHIEKEENNGYAFNIKDEVIHISQAKESGRKGYFCLGCKREMQAVKSKKANRISYFRHDTKAVKGERKCTYSDETHRHLLAKDILQRIKRIKVPALYKYPPKGYEGQAMLISESKFIEAHTVANERIFYENEAGEIKWGKKNEVEEKFLLIKSDVTFFDKDEKPILFIEIVATHKLTDEKKIKLKRLGVDTVQVILPKGSPEDIEKTLLQSTRTKWIYNYEQECTEYIPVSLSSTEGVPSIDEEQRKLFEEGFSCRSSQIKNLVRTIRKCLESQPYAEIDRTIRNELSRVETNTERNREQLRELQYSIRERINNENRESINKVELGQEELKIEESEFQERFRNLECRYIAKRSKLETEERFVGLELNSDIKNNGGTGESFEYRTKEIGRDIEFEGRRIIEIKSNRERLSGKYSQNEADLSSEFEGYEKLERREIERIQKETDGLSRECFTGEISEITKIESIITTIETENYKKLEKEDFTKLKLGQEYSEFFTNGKLLDDFTEKKCYNEKLRRAREFFKSGAYKNWNNKG